MPINTFVKCMVIIIMNRHCSLVRKVEVNEITYFSYDKHAFPFIVIESQYGSRNLLIAFDVSVIEYFS
jgi:hypothetical protein